MHLLYNGLWVSYENSTKARGFSFKFVTLGSHLECRKYSFVLRVMVNFWHNFTGNVMACDSASGILKLTRQICEQSIVCVSLIQGFLLAAKLN